MANSATRSDEAFILAGAEEDHFTVFGPIERSTSRCVDTQPRRAFSCLELEAHHAPRD